MKNKRSFLMRCISVLLIVSMILIQLTGCGVASKEQPYSNKKDETGKTGETNEFNTTEAAITQFPENDPLLVSINQDESLDSIVYSLINAEYEQYYDTFDAEILLPTGQVIEGIGYSDYAAYFESDDNTANYFPAGFILSGADGINNIGIDKDGLVIYNLEFDDPDYGFVCAYNTSSFSKHCVLNQQYIKYGIDENGTIFYSLQPFQKDSCDESLGALYSYDENRFLFNPNVGEYITISGTSLFEKLDYAELEKEVNRILEAQDKLLGQEEITSAINYSREAVSSYLLSLQEESFLGFQISDLICQIESLDTTEFIRLTPDGNLIIAIEDDIPETPTETAKWLVGTVCGMVVISSIALNVFIPAARPFTSAINGAAIESFMQVVIQNHAVSDIQWSKVAVAAVSASLLAWASPLGASTVTYSVGEKTGSILLSKLAGYGVQTISNGVVAGITNATFSIIDKEDSNTIKQSFLTGAILGACCTAAVSILEEIARPIGSTLSNAINTKYPNNFLLKATDSITTYIGKHQVHLSNNAIENIFAPKSVHAAAQAAHEAFLNQYPNTFGGKFDDLINNGTERHECPSFSSTGAEKRHDGPAIKMSPEDHHQTASFGNSNEAMEYRRKQTELIAQGKYREAIQMDINDIRSKFGNKYDDGITQMLQYAQSIGWW